MLRRGHCGRSIHIDACYDAPTFIFSTDRDRRDHCVTSEADELCGFIRCNTCDKYLRRHNIHLDHKKLRASERLRDLLVCIRDYWDFILIDYLLADKQVE